MGCAPRGEIRRDHCVGNASPREPGSQSTIVVRQVIGATRGPSTLAWARNSSSIGFTDWINVLPMWLEIAATSRSAWEFANSRSALPPKLTPGATSEADAMPFAEAHVQPVSAADTEVGVIRIAVARWPLAPRSSTDVRLGAQTLQSQSKDRRIVSLSRGQTP